jgi:adenosylcobinamide kinase/adenosylcobinamide-phosphate guanylyltransferase
MDPNAHQTQPKARFILIGGGVRSGKSAFALERARALGTRRVFIATAEAFDDEMRERAVRHREERGSEFVTLEAPRQLVAALREASRDADVIVVDCLTLWLSNLLLDGLDQPAVLARVDELVTVTGQLGVQLVLVTNEVGLGIVPDSKLGRVFRDVAGAAHQRLAKRCDELYFAVMGQLLRLRPGPVELVVPSASDAAE